MIVLHASDIHKFNLIKVTLSLSEAIIKAGGSPPSFEYLNKMTAVELLCLIGPNDIVFEYRPKNDHSIEVK